MKWDIPLFKVYWDENDIERVNDVIRSGMFWAEGPQIAEFENRIAEYVGAKHSLVFTNGTAALHALLAAHGIGPGDEVIVPSFTFISTVNTVLFVGATPVFADIEERTFGLDPEDVKSRITEKTKAIIPVHYAGCPCDIIALKTVADDAGILMIEDAAEAFGASVNGQKIGTFGDSCMFSFCQNKIISTGEGGAICTDSEDLYDQLKLFRSHGRAAGNKFFETTDKADYISLGYNFRMPSMVAALGLAQLDKVEDIIRMRKEAAASYKKELEKRLDWFTVHTAPSGYDHVWQMFYGIVDGDRDALIEHMKNNGIMTKVYFDPVHESIFHRENQGTEISLPVTEKVSRQIITLPMYPHLNKDEIKTVVSHLETFKKE